MGHMEVRLAALLHIPLFHFLTCRAPILVIATDRGLTLRFFTVGALSKLKGSERMRDFIVNREWQLTAPWSGPWSPRGSR